MVLRREILSILSALNAVRRTLLVIARDHIATLMPAYTHTQPAQPTTLAHYLMAAVEMFGRDERRIQAAFATVNRCPLGACAITTTGFPIDRDFTAELLGFEGLQLNSYGAIAATDYITETAGAVATTMVNLGKVTQDLLLWCTAEFGLLRLSDAWVQSSSIMPQKRNPVPLEHTRVLASKALGQAQGVVLVTHNTPFGDINDSEDDLQPLVFSMATDAARALRLFAGLLAGCEFNTKRMAERANSDFLTVTELADTLVRSEKISFREAHHLVSEAVRNLQGAYSVSGMVEQIIALAHGLQTSRELLIQALDPAHFVAIRSIPGGPAPEAIRPVIDQADAEIAAVSSWLAANSTLLDSTPTRLAAARSECRAGCKPAADC
jgi:argininosuccinate lyase